MHKYNNNNDNDNDNNKKSFHRRGRGGDERLLLPAVPLLPPGSAREFQYDQQHHPVLSQARQRPAGHQGNAREQHVSALNFHLFLHRDPCTREQAHARTVW